jgi:glycosyltransferase involved in cell wall biosynthesis
MTVNRPRVYVGIPAYNAARFLREAIDSVLHQTEVNLRCVVFDDRSSDETQAVCSGVRDERFKYLSNHKKLFLAGNFNRVLKESSAEYIYIMHADDVMLPENIECKADELDAEPDSAFVASTAIDIDAEGRSLTSPADIDTVERFQSGSLFETLLRSNFIIAPSVMIRKSSLRTVGYFDERLSTTCDYNFWLRLGYYFQGSVLHRPLIKYRIHESNDSLPYIGTPLGLEQYSLARKHAIESLSLPSKDRERYYQLADEISAIDALNFAHRAYALGEYDILRACLQRAWEWSPKQFVSRRALILAAKILLRPHRAIAHLSGRS